MYQVLALKFRPQNFDELVGQGHVARTLGNAIRTGRIAHAYIFAGLRGTGKTTVARIMAKCLNCEQGPTIAPCGQCDACREIADSRAMDVLEIDAASRTKVEQTRELLEMVSYAPVRDRYKILIIDEAHMLSKASFNALLKTLEEPPPNVVFVLATTEIQKILPTILSRCQVFEFRRVPGRDVTAQLRKICDAEKIEITDGSLERIARAGEGSVRDSLSALERVIAFCGDTVEDEDVLGLLGGVRAEVLAELVGGLARRDAAAMLGVLDGLAAEGHDLLHFWTEMIAALRDLLMMRAAPDATDLITRSSQETELLRQAAEGLSPEDLSRAFQILADLELPLKSSSQPRFMFETTLIRLASLGAVRPIEELLGSIGSLPARPALAPSPKKKRPVAARPDPPAARDATSPPPPAADLRGRLVADFMEDKPMIGAILEKAGSVDLTADALVLAFEPTLKSQARLLQRRESLALLEKAAARLAGRPVSVRIEFDDPSIAAAPAPLAATAAPRAAPPAAEASPAAEAPPAKSPTRSAAPAIDPEPKTAGGGDGARDSLMRRASNEPGVKRLLREFGAQVVDIRAHEARPKRGPMEEP